jgi:hypothetical protein
MSEEEPLVLIRGPVCDRSKRSQKSGHPVRLFPSGNVAGISPLELQRLESPLLAADRKKDARWATECPATAGSSWVYDPRRGFKIDDKAMTVAIIKAVHLDIDGSKSHVVA